MSKEEYEKMCKDICFMYLTGLSDNDVIKCIKSKYGLTRKEAKLYISQWFVVENSLRG